MTTSDIEKPKFETGYYGKAKRYGRKFEYSTARGELALSRILETPGDTELLEVNAKTVNIKNVKMSSSTNHPRAHNLKRFSMQPESKVNLM